jgi:hypothetical protein
MSTMRSMMLGVASVACVSNLAHAQRGMTPSACHIAAKAAWSVKQREWFDDSRKAWSNDSLRHRLLLSTGLVEGAAVPEQVGLASRDEPRSPGDTGMIASLLTTAATRGSVWPTKSVVGGAGVRAVWLLALRDTALARAALKRMMESGPEEANAADVATLEDRVRLASGRKQIYGTQVVRENGAVRLAPLEDSAHVDLRREEAGLPPVSHSLCLAKATAR